MPLHHLTRAQIETALDAGYLEASMSNGRHWRIRRNGKTKLWATRPDEFRIPVKAGLKSTGYIHESNLHAYRVSPDAPPEFQPPTLHARRGGVAAPLIDLLNLT